MLLLVVGIFFLFVLLKERNENEEYQELKKLADERNRRFEEIFGEKL